MKRNNIGRGVAAALPVFIGYFPIAVTFGLLAKSIDITLLETFSFSALVFAGASQFVALNMIGTGIGAGEIVLTVFLLNFRHFLMSASISSKVTFHRLALPFIAFGITDETFAVASLQNKDLDEGFMLGLNFFSYAGWVSGTAAGYMAGDFLPGAVQESISVCLYAMFVAILMPEVRISIKAGTVAFSAAAANTVLTHYHIFSSGWNIVFSIVAAAAAGMILFRSEA